MNFALILFILLVVSFVAWLIDVLWLARRRRAAAAHAVAEFDRKNQARTGVTAELLATERSAVRENALRRPWYMEYTASFFPVILAVFVLRSFLFEPFRIPSGSMIPTLEIGDLILVNKFDYGIRLPVINRKVIEVGSPQRGDVMVFRFPLQPQQDYIKRVIGLPGDRIEYADKRLTINGTAVPLQPLPRYADESTLQSYAQFSEQLGAKWHRVIVADGAGFLMRALQHTHPEACQYGANSVVCTVPSGHYFVMGDNRDNSEDSRFWGFVPDENIVGRAFLVWLTLRGWVPSFERVGRFD
jgi:signal peptidase I